MKSIRGSTGETSATRAAHASRPDRSGVSPQFARVNMTCVTPPGDDAISSPAPSLRGHPTGARRGQASAGALAGMTEWRYILPMHRVVFIVYPGFELLDSAGPASVFNGANHALSERGRPPFYQVVLASCAGGNIESSSGVAVGTCRMADIEKADTVLVTGAEREPLLRALADPVLQPALRRLIGTADRFGSVCSGGFVLAAMGLLEGCRVATHWASCEPLASAFPRITVDADALYVVDGRLWTSAGVTTGIDMTLVMIARDLDPAIAGDVARRLILYARRPGYQSQFSPVLHACSS